MSNDKVSSSTLVDPIPRPTAGRIEVKMKPEVAEVIFLDNGKPNSMTILKGAQAELRRRGIKVREQIYAKQSAGKPIEGALLGQLSSERGLLLAGVND